MKSHADPELNIVGIYFTESKKENVDYSDRNLRNF